jgi:hypothetical protein
VCRLPPLVLAQCDTLRRHGAGEVAPDRSSELGLRSVQFDHAWQVADIGECDVQRHLVDACSARAGAEVRDPAIECLLLPICIGCVIGGHWSPNVAAVAGLPSAG